MTFGIKDIMEIIPHRQPMLLVDKVEIIEADTKAVGYKGVTYNEPFLRDIFRRSRLCREYSLWRQWPRQRRYFY